MANWLTTLLAATGRGQPSPMFNVPMPNFGPWGAAGYAPRNPYGPVQVGGNLPIPDALNAKAAAFNAARKPANPSGAGRFDPLMPPLQPSRARETARDRVRLMHGMGPYQPAAPMDPMPAAPAPAPQKQGIGARIGNALGNPYLGLGIMEMAKPASQRSYGPMQAGIQHMQDQQRQNTFADYLDAQGMAEEAALVRQGGADPSDVWNKMASDRKARADQMQWEAEQAVREGNLAVREQTEMRAQLKEMNELSEAQQEKMKRFELGYSYASNAEKAVDDLIVHMEAHKGGLGSYSPFHKASGRFGGFIDWADMSPPMEQTAVLMSKLETNIGADAIQTIRDMGGTLGQVTIGEWERLGKIYEGISKTQDPKDLLKAARSLKNELAILRNKYKQSARDEGLTRDEDEDEQFY